jgi:hypothetical protein
VRTQKFDPIRSEQLLLLGRWERNEVTDQQLLERIQAISRRQVRLQESAIARELDRQLEERER